MALRIEEESVGLSVDASVCGSDRFASASMLARRLRLARPLAFLDLETTGTSVENDRIVELAIVRVEPGGEVRHLTSLVHPGRPIPPGATAVHGISDADVAQAPAFSALASEVVWFVEGCDLGGFNVGRFDLRLLAAELERAGVAHQLAEARIVDAMSIFHRNERRDLQAAVRLYVGREHRGHRALEDVEATIDVLLGQLERYGDLPRDIDGLAAYCEGRQPDWLTRNGGVAWRDGAARITFGRHAGKSLETLALEEPAYLRWILERDFPDDLKRLVSEAAEGRFPGGQVVAT